MVARPSPESPRCRAMGRWQREALTVKLIAPIAMDPGLRFAIREGGRTVGAGVVGTITK